MTLIPYANATYIDPFYEESTLVLRCAVVEPGSGLSYARDPRSLAKRAEQYLTESGLGDAAYFGPEPELFIFDSVGGGDEMSGALARFGSEEASGSAGKIFEQANTGHRPSVKGGYLPVEPV